MHKFSIPKFGMNILCFTLLFLLISSISTNTLQAKKLFDKKIISFELIVFRLFDEYRYMGKLPPNEFRKFAAPGALTMRIQEELKSVPVLKCDYRLQGNTWTSEYYWFRNVPDGLDNIDDETVKNMSMEMRGAAIDCPQ